MLIEVTKEDIVEGKRNDSIDCPVALAVQRAFGTVSIPIGLDTDGFYWAGNYKITDNVINNKICQYDRNGVLEPFSFEVDERLVDCKFYQ